MTIRYDSHFARNFLIVSIVIIALIVGLVFFSFSRKIQDLTEDVLLQQARALFDEVVLTRRWTSENGGVSVLSQNSSLYTFHVATTDPLNKATHAPDSFEAKGLKTLSGEANEFVRIETVNKEHVYRYMAPLKH